MRLEKNKNQNISMTWSTNEVNFSIKPMLNGKENVFGIGIIYFEKTILLQYSTVNLPESK